MPANGTIRPPPGSNAQKMLGQHQKPDGPPALRTFTGFYEGKLGVNQ